MPLAPLVFLIAWLVGVVCTFVPLVPATLIILLGAVAATWIESAQHGGFQWARDLPFLLSLGVVTVLVTLVDNLATAWGARRYGGSRQAGWGALAGSLMGLFIPFGLIVGPLAGALAAELLWARRPPGEALRVAWGTLVGLLGGVAAKFVLHLLMGIFGLWWLLR